MNVYCSTEELGDCVMVWSLATCCGARSFPTDLEHHGHEQLLVARWHRRRMIVSVVEEVRRWRASPLSRSPAEQDGKTAPRKAPGRADKRLRRRADNEQPLRCSRPEEEAPLYYRAKRPRHRTRVCGHC